MKRIMRCVATLAIAGLLGSCGLFDAGVEWRGGPYALLWIDTPDNISICRDLGGGSWSGRVDRTVFAVGWNGRYLMAKQHPDGDLSVTHYFIVDAMHDVAHADLEDVVYGPFTAAEFQEKSRSMHLPGFSKILASLQ